MSRRGEPFSRGQPTPPAVGEHRRVPGTPRLRVGVLTWASSALHTSCSLSGVMSTGTSNGEPSNWPPSSWNCTSSRCTSPAAASSCGNKPGGSQCPPLLPSGLGTPRGDPASPPCARTPTATASAILRPHVEEKRGGGMERQDRVAWQPRATVPSAVRRRESGVQVASSGGLRTFYCIPPSAFHTSQPGVLSTSVDHGS